MAGLVRRVQESFILLSETWQGRAGGWVPLGDWDGCASFSLSVMVPGLLPLHLASR